MINVLSRLQPLGSTKTVIKATTLLKFAQNSKKSALFSIRNGYYHPNLFNGNSNRNKQLPNLLYVQNPITWLNNKIDFFMLKRAWDPEFDEKEFKRGVKQAVSVICTLMSENLWSDLEGLISSKTLNRLQRDVEVNWNAHKRKSIAIHPSDIHLVLTRKVHFLRIAEQKLVDVDVICVAIKFLENQPSRTNYDILLLEVLARFQRNYSMGQFSNWTATIFKVSTQHIYEK